jgi:hypothetical protein
MKGGSTTAGHEKCFQQLMGVDVHNSWGKFFLGAQVPLDKTVRDVWKKTVKFPDCQHLHTMLKHASL